MNRLSLVRVRRFSARGRRRIAACLAAAILAGAVAMHIGCTGGTTGVDNPGLTSLPVDFRDQAGGPALVQGSLEIYDRDHNPAVRSEPLLRLEVQNRSGLQLTAADFDRIHAARALKAAAASQAHSADPAGPAGSDSLIRFNLVFRSGSASGAVATGLSYDPVRKVFGLDPLGPAAGVRMLPKPLIRFAARIHRDAGAGDPGRIFLPGTPFQATLIDSDFALQNLPEGRFGMRLLDGGGYIYAVRETLDTRSAQSFTADPNPIARVDSAIAPAGFGVIRGGNFSANAQESAALQGRLVGVDSNDSRLSVRWRLLRSLSSDTALIEDPTRLSTRILFPVTGGYLVELSATLGATTVKDTVQYKVSPPAGTLAAKFIMPQPGDSIKQGVEYKVTWDAALSGLVRLEYSIKDATGGSWVVAADSVKVSPGGNPAAWAPPILGTVVPCFLRLRMIPSDSILAQTTAPFYLVP